MGKHVLDRRHRRPRRAEADHLDRFARLDRQALADRPGPVARRMLRRAKGPLNDALRMQAFLRIERGYSA